MRSLIKGLKGTQRLLFIQISRSPHGVLSKRIRMAYMTEDGLAEVFPLDLRKHQTYDTNMAMNRLLPAGVL
jgi:hypothetical protein